MCYGFRYLTQFEREEDVVKLLLISGYPMRKLLSDTHDDDDDEGHEIIRETLGTQEKEDNY